MFDSQPILNGRFVGVRPLRSDDWVELFKVASDPVIWEQHPSSDRYEESVFRQFFHEALESGGAVAVLDQANGKIIGSSRFHGYDADRSEVEIGWTFLARPYWGGVYNGELKALMLAHAFRFTDSVVFYVGVNNIRSCRAVEKIGGIRIGIAQRPSGNVVKYIVEKGR